MSWLLSLASKTILFAMGWKHPSDEIFDKLNRYPHTVLVFSHTSYADFYIMILYLLAYPDKLKYLRTLVKPQPFAYAGWLLKRLGAIPATKIEDSNGGAVARIVEELNRDLRCMFLISPKGTIVKRDWRSGYYYIAQQLDAKLRAAGLDYERKCVVVSDAICHTEGEECVKGFLQDEMSEIVPLFPEEEIMPIRSHVEGRRSIMSKKRLLSIIMGMIAVVIGFMKYY